MNDDEKLASTVNERNLNKSSNGNRFLNSFVFLVGSKAQVTVILSPDDDEPLTSTTDPTFVCHSP